MNLQPINDRILVRLFEHPSEEQKIGSIIVPEVAREKENICGSQVYLDKPFHRGTVVAAGPGRLMEITCKRCGNESVTRREMSIKVGDVVLFGKFYDMAMEDLVLLREDDILAVEADFDRVPMTA